VRIAYLGPAGTFTEDALREALGPSATFEPLRTATIREAILMVERGEAERALVPVENSIEGSVRSTLDTLALEASGVTIVGEHDFAVRAMLIAREGIELGRVERVLSHPQPLAQCAHFLAENLPAAGQESRDSTAAAVKEVSEAGRPWAAIGARSAATLYGCEVLREGIEDEPNNVTRFVWIAPAGTRPEEGGEWKTSLVFSELGADHPGALVEALQEFSSRNVNLTRIESRPMRSELGRYMFFCDLEGAAGDEAVAGAIAALRTKAESVRLLGSYPVGEEPGTRTGSGSGPPPA
jgi:prephenate dehydratase